MRIALGQLWQETNSLNPLPTQRENFDQFGVLRGDDMVERLATTNEVGGFIQSLRKWPEQPELVGLVRLPAWPSGPATADTFAWIQDEMKRALDRAGPVDAVLLALHGAMAAEGHWDVEGEILRLVRENVGPKTPHCRHTRPSRQCHAIDGRASGRACALPYGAPCRCL
jgi:microcystin degradation protein MlrC